MFVCVLQVAAIKTLAKLAKRVWLKLDACDIKVALQESKDKKWNGDANLGELKVLRQEYGLRLRTFEEAMKTGRQDAIGQVVAAVESDAVFLRKVLSDALVEYQKVIQREKGQNMLMERCWNVADGNILTQQASAFIDRFNTIRQRGTDQERAQQLERLQEGYEIYLRDCFKKKRTAATHVLVIMASDELRMTKPYALPLQYLPYRSMKDQYLRDITKAIKQQLLNAGVLVVGM